MWDCWVPLSKDVSPEFINLKEKDWILLNHVWIWIQHLTEYEWLCINTSGIDKKNSVQNWIPFLKSFKCL